MRKFAYGLMVLALVGFAASAAQATAITWGSAQGITGDTDVSLEGTLVRAHGANAATVNGVAFAADWSVNSPTYSTTATAGPDTFSSTTLYLNKNATVFGSAAAPFVNLSTAYKTLLQGAVYADHVDTATYTFGGLTNGQKYLVQLWVNDSRASQTWTQTVDGTVATDPNTTTTNVAGGMGQYIIGRFTASAATQAFTIVASAGGVEMVFRNPVAGSSGAIHNRAPRHECGWSAGLRMEEAQVVSVAGRIA